MCLAVLEWRPGQAIPLRAVANRDEDRQRPTLALAPWPGTQLVGGRDLQAGGSWLAFDGRARFALLTNLRSPGPITGKRSRGELVARYLLGSQPATVYASDVAAHRGQYGPFNLLLGEQHSLLILSSADGVPRSLTAGIHCISNAAPGDEWPKCRLARDQMRDQGDRLESALTGHGILTDTRAAPDDSLPDTGLAREIERRLSAQTILGEGYGTRSRTHFLRDLEGSFRIAEEQLDAAGRVTALRELRMPREADPS